ncbi:CheR family methyltransferase [Noviherbaspirillum massiliense]|uniref:CheR family methyltransferase n=1 Tax=Noviherbaspirillum massiliense TaxID=1465823 RepID=UPI00030309BB|nr:CheR family methyltransferase [Noviherbaspirillum massiliense]
MEQAQSIEDLEIDLLLEGVFQLSGHDFRGYRRGLLARKLHALMQAAKLNSVSMLQDRVLHDPHMLETLLRMLGAKTAGLFDDPAHFLALREALGPWLRSCPSPKVWIAECTSAEDIATLAILLAEEGVYDKTQVFATAANEGLLEEASRGILAAERIREYEDNYRRSGGKHALADYCREDKGHIVLLPRMLSNITWAQYSLATNASFNEFELIVCRGTLGEFGAPLRRRTLQLFHESLPVFGMLSVDQANEMACEPFASRYKSICANQGLYRRMA